MKAYLKAGRPLSPIRNWVTGLLPTVIAGGFFGIRRWSDLTFDGPAGVPLPFFRDLQRVSYLDRIRYRCALTHYLEEGFTYIELGDAEELWENDNFDQIYITHMLVYKLLEKFHDPDPVKTRYLKV